MKMKVKTLACLCALVAIPAFGTEAVTSANTFGVLKVTCSAQKVIIATPWVECLTAGNVKVTDLVMTDNLAEGDAIIVYAGNNQFKSWRLNGSKQWSSVAVTGAGGTVTGGAAADAAIARGKAFWFVKVSYSEPYDLYLYGQDTSATATSTVVAGTPTTPAYSLVASPKTTAADLNSGVSFFTPNAPNAADEIRLPRTNLPDLAFTYQDGQWGTKTNKVEIGTTGRYRTEWVAGCTIPAGTGFWYVSKGGSGTITW